MDVILERAVEIKERTAKILEARGTWDTDEPSSAILEKVEDFLPGRIDFDPGICAKCDFQPWCVPDITRAQGIIDRLSDDDLNEDCQIFTDTKDPRDAYEAANKRILGHGKAVMIDEKPGSGKVLITKDFGITLKKTAKSVTKKVLPLEDVLKGQGDD